MLFHKCNQQNSHYMKWQENESGTSTSKFQGKKKKKEKKRNSVDKKRAERYKKERIRKQAKL